MAANVILAKCGVHTSAFGIRVEERGNEWVSTWAFPIDESKAKREGYDKTKITVSFIPTDDYPGCPHCGSKDLIQCGCGRMICRREGMTFANSEKKSEKKQERKTDDHIFRCPWCGVVIKEIQEAESFTVKTNNF
jgi:DNA-directed RNA polymerase subunit RPC12/RpoP